METSKTSHSTSCFTFSKKSERQRKREKKQEIEKNETKVNQFQGGWLKHILWSQLNGALSFCLCFYRTKQ